jgi:hypothetical protein
MRAPRRHESHDGRAPRPIHAARSDRYEAGLNLYSYVNGDPVNWVDPLGLEPHDLSCGGGGCADIAITGGGASGRHGTLLDGGSAAKFFLDAPVETGSGGGGVLGAIADTLDDFAEKHLKPPEKRKKSETPQQCFKRIAGMSPALGAVGAFSVGAGGAWLGYSRTGISGGGGGTSLISSAARDAFGKAFMGRGILGTGSLGGAIGRVLSRASVFGGAAAVGWSAGTSAGAAQICR